MTFITIGCATEEVNFFTSGSYDRDSFSRSWTTRSVPDTEGLTSVFLQVLDLFNIPAVGPFPLGGTLPGVDIKRMDATQAIKLSLAESLVQGQWWEMYEDNQGGVKFQLVFDNGGPGATVTLDIRLCIPSSSVTNEVDMVIVHGYDPPPERYVRPWRDVVPAGSGPVNPQTLTGQEDLFTIDFSEMINSCHVSKVRNECVKSYRDPAFTDSLGPQEINPFYDLQAWESLVGYVIDVDGMPLSPEDAARVTYDFQATTTWYYRPTFPDFQQVTDLSDVFGADCAGAGVQTGTGIVYYSGDINYTSPNFVDKYGYNWPLVIRPAKILYAGYKIENVIQLGANTNSASNFVFVSPLPEFNELQSQWVYTIPGINQYKITLYYQPKLDPVVWDVFLSILQGGSGDVTLKLADGTDKWLTSVSEVPGFSGAALGVLPGPNSLGYYITDMWLALTIDRPSVKITDHGGQARQYSDSLRVQYAPLVVYDAPAPIAYKHKDIGLVKLDADTLGEALQDSDPTTCQNFEETPEQIMYDLATGNTVELNLPFCVDDEECAAVAETIFNYQNYVGVQRYTITCGPDDEPELGAAVTGFDTSLRIESINYSYQDGSSYTIEVTLGPIFSNVGSWNAGAWLRKVETVSRPAIVIWTAGDGTNYRVNVRGLGEYNAINSAKDIWRVGEMVNVSIYNVPVEE